MAKDNVQPILANLKALNVTNEHSKIEINGMDMDYTQLQEALSSGKVKGTVKIDKDGDGIFDVQIKAKALQNENIHEVGLKLEKTKHDTHEGLVLAEELVQIDEFKTDKDVSKHALKTVARKEKDILKDLEAMGADPNTFKQRVLKERADEAKRLADAKEKPPVAAPPADAAKDASKVDEKKYTKYVVQRGESPSSIAKKFGLEGDAAIKFKKELLEHNKDNVKTFKGKQTGKPVKGFWVDAEIELPGDFYVADNVKESKKAETKKETQKADIKPTAKVEQKTDGNDTKVKTDSKTKKYTKNGVKYVETYDEKGQPLKKEATDNNNVKGTWTKYNPATGYYDRKVKNYPDGTVEVCTHADTNGNFKQYIRSYPDGKVEVYSNLNKKGKYDRCAAYYKGGAAVIYSGDDGKGNFAKSTTNYNKNNKKNWRTLKKICRNAI